MALTTVLTTLTVQDKRGLYKMALDPSFYDDVIAQISGGAKDFRGGATELRNIAAKQEFQQQAPDLISEMNGQGIGLYSPAEARGQLAQLAFNSGDPTILRQLVKDQFQPKKMPEQALPDSAIDADPTLRKEMKAQLKLLKNDPAAQNKAYNQYQQAIGILDSRDQEYRRNKQFIQGQRTALNSELSKISKNIRETDELYNNVKDAMAKGTLPADAVVFNFLARKLANEKGPLSDSDRAQFISRAFEGDKQKFDNFISGASTSPLTDEQRQAFKDLIDQSVKNYEKVKASAVEDTLSQAIGGKPDLFTDTADKLATDFAKKYGFEYTKKDGVWELNKKEVIKSAAPTGGSANTNQETAKPDPLKSQEFLALDKVHKGIVEKAISQLKNPTYDKIQKIVNGAKAMQDKESIK